MFLFWVGLRIRVTITSFEKIQCVNTVREKSFVSRKNIKVESNYVTSLIDRGQGGCCLAVCPLWPDWDGGCFDLLNDIQRITSAKESFTKRKISRVKMGIRTDAADWYWPAVSRLAHSTRAWRLANDVPLWTPQNPGSEKCSRSPTLRPVPVMAVWSFGPNIGRNIGRNIGPGPINFWTFHGEVYWTWPILDVFSTGTSQRKRSERTSLIENVRFDLFLCEVPVENTANIGPGPINFSVKRPEVDWSRTNIDTNIVTNIGTKLQIGMTGTTLTKNWLLTFAAEPVLRPKKWKMSHLRCPSLSSDTNIVANGKTKTASTRQDKNMKLHETGFQTRNHLTQSLTP